MGPPPTHLFWVYIWCRNVLEHRKKHFPETIFFLVKSCFFFDVFWVKLKNPNLSNDCRQWTRDQQIHCIFSTTMWSRLMKQKYFWDNVWPNPIKSLCAVLVNRCMIMLFWLPMSVVPHHCTLPTNFHVENRPQLHQSQPPSVQKRRCAMSICSGTCSRAIPMFMKPFAIHEGEETKRKRDDRPRKTNLTMSAKCSRCSPSRFGQCNIPWSRVKTIKLTTQRTFIISITCLCCLTKLILKTIYRIQ